MSVGIDTAVSCADLCTDQSNCLSFDHSERQARCILHSDIEGPQTLEDDDYENRFETLPLQASQDFVHYERLGQGNSTLYTLTGLSLQHRRTFYINLRISNLLGYSNVVSSQGVLVDLTPPTPGRIRNAEEDVLQNEECGFNIEQNCIGDSTPVNNHRLVCVGVCVCACVCFSVCTCTCTCFCV